MKERLIEVIRYGLGAVFWLFATLFVGVASWTCIPYVLFDKRLEDLFDSVDKIEMKLKGSQNENT